MPSTLKKAGEKVIIHLDQGNIELKIEEITNSSVLSSKYVKIGFEIPPMLKKSGDKLIINTTEGDVEFKIEKIMGRNFSNSKSVRIGIKKPDKVKISYQNNKKSK